jgi:glycosyltransferase involved in cell wall biosynthesis
LADVLEKGSMCLISIITVVYNGEKEIERTVRSVIEQTNKNFEYIIIDGNSSDKTISIIDRFKKDIDVVITELDKGIYYAMNKAVDLAKGNWLYFLNCGDYFINHNVIDQVEKDLQSEFGSLVVYKVNVVDKVGHVIDKFPHQIKASSYRQLFYSKYCHQGIFARREDYLKVGKFDVRFKVYSDFYSVGKILKSGVKLVSRPLTITAYNDLGVSNNWKNVVSLSKEREVILSLLDEDFSSWRFSIAVLKSYLYYLRKFFQKNA